ncbi:MAG: aminoacyl-tRNA hydrolase [Planctomycetota bacterium JB042]
MRIVAGLGNPGPEYVGTRHNVGFDVVDRLADRIGLDFRDRGGEAAVADGRHYDPPCLLVKPLTYMNLSGGPLRKILRDLEGRIEETLVVSDDFNLDLGRLRLRRGGSDGGHNGLKSIIALCKTDAFPRLRVGVGPPPERMPVEVFVLRRFDKEQERDVKAAVARAADAARDWIEGEAIDRLMNRANRPPT